MSRIANSPINFPPGVNASLAGQVLNIKGPKGSFEFVISDSISATKEGGTLKVAPKNPAATGYALAGTVRSLIYNMVVGVNHGFEKKLELVGVGYRAQAQGKRINLMLGFSHPVIYSMPEGVTVETPTLTEIVIKGVDKQKVGQVAAEIRAFRPPEPYKGKGVRYANEQIFRKESKKK